MLTMSRPQLPRFRPPLKPPAPGVGAAFPHARMGRSYGMALCLAFAFARMLAAQASRIDAAWDLLAKGQRAQAIAVLREAIKAEPVDGDARLLLGSVLLEERQAAESIEDLKAAVRLKPESSEAHNALGEAYSTFGYPKAARPEFEQAVRIDPRFAQAHVNLASSLLLDDETAPATAHLNRAISLSGQTADAAYPLYLRGRLQLDAREPAKALLDLEQAVKLRPDFAEAWSDLGEARRNLLDDPGALDAFQHAVELSPDDAVAQTRYGSKLLDMGRAHDSLPHLQAAVRLDPSNQSALNGLQSALRRDGQTAQADAVRRQLAELIRERDKNDQGLMQSLQASGQSPAVGRRNQAAATPGAQPVASPATGAGPLKPRAIPAADTAALSTASKLGLAYYKSGDFLHAAEQFENLRAVLPADSDESVRNSKLLADCYLRRGESKRVIEVLDPVADSRPDDLATAYMLGTALLQQKEEERAVHEFERIMSRADTPEARLLLATRKMQATDLNGALDEILRCIELKPDLADAHVIHGRILMLTADLGGAEAAFRRAITVDPNSFEALLELSALAREQGKLTEARESVTHALSLRPSDIPARYQLALVESADNRDERAVKLLEGVVRDAPRFAEAHRRLAALFFRLHRPEDGGRERQIADRLAGEKQQRDRARQGGMKTP